MIFNPLDDDLSVYGELVSVDAFNGIAVAINYLIDSMPVGTIVPILMGFTGVPEPDARLWKLCDGSMITDQNSELRNNLAPDMRDRFLKGADSPGVAGQLAGSNTKNFAHNHGGVTQANDIGGDNGEFDDDWLTIYSHTHPIPSSGSTLNVEPVHFRVLHYIKIR